MDCSDMAENCRSGLGIKTDDSPTSVDGGNYYVALFGGGGSRAAGWMSPSSWDDSEGSESDYSPLTGVPEGNARNPDQFSTYINSGSCEWVEDSTNADAEDRRQCIARVRRRTRSPRGSVVCDLSDYCNTDYSSVAEEVRDPTVSPLKSCKEPAAEGKMDNVVWCDGQKPFYSGRYAGDFPLPFSDSDVSFIPECIKDPNRNPDKYSEIRESSVDNRDIYNKPIARLSRILEAEESEPDTSLVSVKEMDPLRYRSYNSRNVEGQEVRVTQSHRTDESGHETRQELKTLDDSSQGYKGMNTSHIDCSTGAWKKMGTRMLVTSSLCRMKYGDIGYSCTNWKPMSSDMTQWKNSCIAFESGKLESREVFEYQQKGNQYGILEGCNEGGNTGTVSDKSTRTETADSKMENDKFSNGSSVEYGEYSPNRSSDLDTPESTKRGAETKDLAEGPESNDKCQTEDYTSAQKRTEPQQGSVRENYLISSSEVRSRSEIESDRDSTDSMDREANSKSESVATTDELECVSDFTSHTVVRKPYIEEIPFVGEQQDGELRGNPKHCEEVWKLEKNKRNQTVIHFDSDVAEKRFDEEYHLKCGATSPLSLESQTALLGSSPGGAQNGGRSSGERTTTGTGESLQCGSQRANFSDLSESRLGKERPMFEGDQLGIGDSQWNASRTFAPEINMPLDRGDLVRFSDHENNPVKWGLGNVEMNGDRVAEPVRYYCHCCLTLEKCHQRRSQAFPRDNWRSHALEHARVEGYPLSDKETSKPIKSFTGLNQRSKWCLTEGCIRHEQIARENNKSFLSEQFRSGRDPESVNFPYRKTRRIILRRPYMRLPKNWMDFSRLPERGRNKSRRRFLFLRKRRSKRDTSFEYCYRFPWTPILSNRIRKKSPGDGSGCFTYVFKKILNFFTGISPAKNKV